MAMKTELIQLDKLEMDLKNPRIARMLEMYDPATLTADQIALALGAGESQSGDNYTTFYNLKESIRTNGGIIHPIIVNRNTEGHNVVIEGNTRLQIYREFLKENVQGDWTLIPAIIHEDLSEQKMDAIRLQAHLVGPRPWDPYSKAKYLNYLSNSDHLTLDQIVEFCGGKRKDILNYISAYDDMEKYYRPLLESDSEFDTTRFSAFVELQRPNIKKAIIMDGKNKKDFSRWVIDGLLNPLQNVRLIPRIFEHEKAKETFLKEGAQEAMKLLDTAPAGATLEEASLLQLAQELTRRIARLELKDIQRIKSDPKGKEKEVLYDANAQLEELFTFITDE